MSEGAATWEAVFAAACFHLQNRIGAGYVEVAGAIADDALRADVQPEEGRPVRVSGPDAELIAGILRTGGVPAEVLGINEPVVRDPLTGRTENPEKIQS